MAEPAAASSGELSPSSPALSSAADVSQRPRRVMGLRDLILYYLVTGISLRWISFAATAGPSVLVIWLGAWLAFALPLILSVIELSSRYPQEGGLYVWSKRAFGEFGGFLAGWTYWTSNLPYFPTVLYFAAGSALYLSPSRFGHLSTSPKFFMVFSLLGLAVITVLNVIGLDIGKWLHNLGALGMWLPILILVVMAALTWNRFGSVTHFTRASLVPSTRLEDIIFWSIIAFALCGCESASFMGDEIKDPRRNVPRALFTGSLLSTFGYIVGTVAILSLMPNREVTGLEGFMQAVAHGGERLSWVGVIPLVAALIMISNLGAAGAYLAACSRVPFVAGLDRYLPEAFARLHPRWGTPHISLLTQLFAAGVFVFLGQAGTSVKGAYDVLVSMTVITTFIPYLFLFAAMIRLQREPAGPEVIRVPGGRGVATVLAALGFTTTAVCIFLSLVPPADEPNKLLAVVKILGLTSLLLGMGVVAYLLGKSRAARAWR